MSPRETHYTTYDEKTDQELSSLEFKYKPLMEAFIKLQKEAALTIDNKGYPLAFYRALESFVDVLKRIEGK